MGQCLRVLEGQRARRRRQPRRPSLGLYAPRRDADDVGAELRELGEHETVHARTDRGEQDHGRDADRDAEQREKAAQPVRGDRTHGERDAVAQDHRLASASTGSMRAARRAGSTPNTSPVTIEVPSPASTAQSGAKAG